MNRVTVLKAVIWGGLAAVIATIAVSYLVIGPSGRSDAEESLPVFGTVSSFALTNQSGAEVSLSDLAGEIWLADIIFTRCPGPCARMTRQMKKVSDLFKDVSGVRFLSITTDPEHDTPQVLAEYASRFGATGRSWDFLTGPKPLIQQVAVDNLKLVLFEKPLEERTVEDDLFLHSTYFVLVDAKGRIRAYVEGAEDDAPEKAAEAIRELLRERGR